MERKGDSSVINFAPEILGLVLGRISISIPYTVHVLKVTVRELQPSLGGLGLVEKQVLPYLCIMKTRKTTLILILLGMLFALPVEQANAQFTGKIKRIKIKKRRVGSGFKVYGKFSGGSEGATVKAELTAIGKSPKPLVNSFNLNVASTEKNGVFNVEKDFACIKEDCLFGKEVAAIGDKYKITAVLVDKSGKPISKNITQEIIVELDDSDCKNKHTLHHLSISGFDFYSPYSEENNSDYPLLIKDKNSNGNTISVDVAFKRKPAVWFYPGSTRLQISAKSSSNSESSVTTITPFYDEEKQVLTAKWPDMDSVLITNMTITTTVCGEEYKTKEVNFNKIESVQGDEIHFKLKKGKETSCNDKDSTCTAPLTLSNGITLNSTVNGSFQVLVIDGVKITQKDKPLTDLEVESILEMKDCKGTTIYVAIPLKYNDKTGTYTNSKALSLCKENGMEVVSMNLSAKGKDLPLHKWTHVAVRH